MLTHSDVLSLGRGAIEDCFVTPEIAVTAYTLKSTKRLLAKLSTVDRGPKRVECLRGGAGFRDGPEVL